MVFILKVFRCKISTFFFDHFSTITTLSSLAPLLQNWASSKSPCSSPHVTLRTYRDTFAKRSSTALHFNHLTELETKFTWKSDQALLVECWKIVWYVVQHDKKCSMDYVNLSLPEANSFIQTRKWKRTQIVGTAAGTVRSRAVTVALAFCSLVYVSLFATKKSRQNNSLNGSAKTIACEFFESIIKALKRSASGSQRFRYWTTP